MSYYKAAIMYFGDLISVNRNSHRSDVCPCCHEQMYNREVILRLICGHFIHLSCFKLWSANCVNVELPCPLCRTGLEDMSRGITRMSALESDSMNFVHPMELRGENYPTLLAARNSYYLSLNRTSGYSLGQFTQRVIMPLFLEQHNYFNYGPSFYMSKLDGQYHSNIGTLPHYRERNHWFQDVHDLYHAFKAVVIILYNWNYEEPSHTEVQILPGVVAELKNFWTGKRRTINEYELSVIKCKELTKVVDADVNVELLTNNLAPLLALYDHTNVYEIHGISHDEVTIVKDEARGYWVWFKWKFISLLLYLLSVYCCLDFSIVVTDTPYLVLPYVCLLVYLNNKYNV